MVVQTNVSVSDPAIAARSGAAATALFAFALFVSAFLLFVLEPMVAKSMLPKLGGTPMVWNTCVVFFQAMLLIGYLAAHLSVRRNRRRWVAWLYPALITAGVLALPLSFTRLPLATDRPSTWLLGELVRVTAVPIVALSMTAPVLQSWFSRMALRGTEDPYFLYAASNAGSLLALLSYPTIIEPVLGLQPQARLWAGGYAVLAALVGTCAVVMLRYPQRHLLVTAPTEDAIGGPQRVRWIALAFIPSSLMLGVTTYISTDIAAVPLIWVLPLALYLASFVIVFGHRTGNWAAAAERRVPLLAVALTVFMASSAALPIQFDVPLHLAMFTAVSMMCHGRLAAERPRPQHLTDFYLLLSLGGMMGGLFNTLIAPLLFDRVAEYPIVLICACAVPVLYPGEWAPAKGLRDLSCAAITAVCAAVLNVVIFRSGMGSTSFRVTAVGALGLIVFTQARYRIRFAMMLGALLLASALTQRVYTPVLESERTFFGSYRLTIEEGGKFYALTHGTTVHGMEAIDASSLNEPLTYYHRSGPFGQAHERMPRLRDATDIAVIGLGAGSLAAYAGASQHWVFFEIDPAVERMARDQRYFHFLESCGSRCSVVLGDARLSLARSDQRFDAIVLDAFSSDSIPLHLLTREALSNYLHHLRPGGLLLFHVSNRYLQLGPALARLLQDQGLMAVEQAQQNAADDIQTGKYASDWVIASADAGAIHLLAMDPRWKPLSPQRQMRVWTDDYSNILTVLKLLN
jgi:spermidine synthase